MAAMRYLLPPPLLLISALIAGSQTAMAQVKMEGTGPFANLKLLEPVEVASQMTAYTRGLGVTCGRCHMPADYASDEAPDKEIARRMIILTGDINAKYFGGAGRVTCYTCHHGTALPTMKPAVQ
jgi:hypothetical protein